MSMAKCIRIKIYNFIKELGLNLRISLRGHSHRIPVLRYERERSAGEREMIGIGWKRKDTKAEKEREKAVGARKRRTGIDRKRKKRAIAVPEEDDALSKAKVSLAR